MPRTQLDRRRYLELCLAGTATALAGCLGDGSDTANPAYADWIPATDNGVRYVGVDLAIADEDGDTTFLTPLVPRFTGGDGEQPSYRPDLSGVENPDDPLLALPVRTAVGPIAGAALALGVLGLGSLVDPEGDSPLDRLHSIDGTIVATGDVATASIDGRLRAGTPDDGGTVPFDAAGELAEFTLYDAVPDDEAVWVAVSDDALIVADTRDRAVAVVESVRGDRERLIGGSETFEWLADAAGSGHLVVGWYDATDVTEFHWEDVSEPVHGVFTSAQDVLASATFSPEDGSMTVDLAVETAGGGDRRDELEAALGSASGDSSVSIDGRRLSATGTYDGEAIELERVEKEGNEFEDLPEGEDLPAAVAESVPEEAFEFRYDEQDESVRVEVVEEVEADEIRIVAVDSGYEVSATTPSEGSWFSIILDPAGDEVVVVATVDGSSGIVAREQYP